MTDVNIAVNNGIEKIINDFQVHPHYYFTEGDIRWRLLREIEIISGYVNDLHDLFKEGSLSERRAFIRSFVREIKVTGNEVVLNYTMPFLADNLTMGKEGVLPIVQHGGRYWT